MSATTPTRLSAAEIDALVSSLDGWIVDDGTWLERRWAFGDFDAAVAFIEQVFAIARELDHHPDLYNVYDQVRIRLSTHDAGGLTERDAAFARRVDSLGTA